MASGSLPRRPRWCRAQVAKTLILPGAHPGSKNQSLILPGAHSGSRNQTLTFPSPVHSPGIKNQTPGGNPGGQKILAATYSPRTRRSKYHRRWRA